MLYVGSWWYVCSQASHELGLERRAQVAACPSCDALASLTGARAILPRRDGTSEDVDSS